MNMKFMGILLREGRKEDLKKKYSDKFSEEDLNFVLNISDLQDFNHKYTDFILKSLRPNSEDLDMEVDVAIGLVKDFDKYQSQLEKKDINQYKNFEELDSALFPLKVKEKERDLEKQVQKIYEDDKFLVVKPKTEEASCKYGSNTKWCVTSKGSGHFGRYTSGSQGLYFIINKANSTNKNYSKIAIHFDSGGTPKYWDSQDNILGNREVDVVNYAFPELIDAINDDYKVSSQSSQDKFLQEVFNLTGSSVRVERRFLGGEGSLNVSVEGFSTINDLGPGHAEGHVVIDYNMNLIDSYQIFITYKVIDTKIFSASIGFMGDDLTENKNYIDLELEGWGFDSKYLIQGFAENTSESIRNHIASKVLDYVKGKPQLQQKVIGSARVWKPKVNYGYTFGKNKGMIKKLVDWLDSGKKGTRLDFLVDTGYLDTIEKDGKIKYRRKTGGFILDSKDLRGQYSSFFASAVSSGILKNVKQGKKFILTKGPNFDAFKEGKLKAL